MIEWKTYHLIVPHAYVLAYTHLWLHKVCEPPAAQSLKTAFERVVWEQAGERGLSWQAEVMDVDSCSLGTMSQECSLINIPYLQPPGASSCFNTVHLFSFLGALMKMEKAILTLHILFSCDCILQIIVFGFEVP